jgi:hypothetical protein
MGTETAKALQARRRESRARIDRLIALADERSPISSIRRTRIAESAGLARRRLRALATTQQAAAAIELEIGQALLRVVDQGLSRNEAFELAGVSRHLGRRYVELVLRARDQGPAHSSTAPDDEVGSSLTERDLDLNGDSPRHATEGREV